MNDILRLFIQARLKVIAPINVGSGLKVQKRGDLKMQSS
jgi:hypothetical protein